MVSHTLKWLAAVALVAGATAFKVDACVERKQSAKGIPAHPGTQKSPTDAAASHWLMTHLVVPSPVP